ncbi:RPL23A [Cordylochernes scorpioides]|uniref:RPL23A n=1 Tax=Cordylochernes scorpioides TaxID=51811 RepID=A0ABY6K9N6_9ARAC|nr:RPL23A [Cordylochernes scorpioides]
MVPWMSIQKKKSEAAAKRKKAKKQAGARAKAIATEKETIGTKEETIATKAKTIATKEKNIATKAKTIATKAKTKILKGVFNLRSQKRRTSVHFRRPKTLCKPRTPEYPRTSMPKSGGNDYHRIIKQIIATEAAMKKIEMDNTLVFLVDKRANKHQIKEAIEKLYKVTAQRVNTLISCYIADFGMAEKPAAAAAAAEPAPAAPAKKERKSSEKKPVKAMSKAKKEANAAKAKASIAKRKVLKGEHSKRSQKRRNSVHFRRPKTLCKSRQPAYPRKSVPKTCNLATCICWWGWYFRELEHILIRKKFPVQNLILKWCRLDQFSIIKHPLTTESAMKKIEDHNTLVFLVDKRANKHQIKAAVAKLYDITVQKINTLIRPDGEKKAYVRLPAHFDSLDVANKIGII